MECDFWTLEKYQSLNQDEIKKLSNEEFHSLAEMQSTFFPDLLRITDESEIQNTFYRAYARKR